MSHLKHRFTANKKELPRPIERKYPSEWGSSLYLALQPPYDREVENLDLVQVENLINKTVAEVVAFAHAKDNERWFLPADEMARRAKWFALGLIEDYLSIDELARLVVVLTPHLNIRKSHSHDSEMVYFEVEGRQGSFLGIYQADSLLDELK